jgi:diguanylate cyclase (GGDEF)-like protein
MIIMRDLADMVQSELESIQLSTTDELTKLSNRRGFLFIANHAFQICQRENKKLTLLFFDLDKFKYINDTFGHAEGDKVLKVFSQLLLEEFRSSDIIARLGGDEFCVLCSGVKEENIQLLLNRLQDAVNANHNTKYNIHYSVGCIQYDSKKHQTIHDLLSDADSRMYEHKRRNTS